jgi:hypothetical protein
MLTQLTPKDVRGQGFPSSARKKARCPLKKIVGSGAFPELLRSFYGELLRRPRFLPQIFKFGGRGVKVYGQSLRSEFSPEMRKMVLVEGQVIFFETGY